MPGDLSAYPNDFEALLSEFNSEVAGLMSRLEAHQVTTNQWQDEMKSLQARYAQAARILGSGVDEPLQNADQEAVGSWLDEQYKYLDGFASVISATRDYNPAWLTRAQQYGSATVTEYWEGKTGDVPVPAQPGQGTQCHGNCRCEWRIVDLGDGSFDCYWELGEADHCQTCVIRHAEWYPVHVVGGSLVGPEAPRSSEDYSDYTVDDPTGKKGDPIFDDLTSGSGYKKWMKSLPKYVKKAVSDYALNGYKHINSMLRNNSNDLDPATYLIDDVLKNAKIPHNMYLSRSFASEDLFNGIENGTIKSGYSFKDRGFVSTSANNGVEFFSTSDIAMTIHIRAKAGSRGAYIAELSSNSHENEVLLPRDSAFKITKISKKMDPDAGIEYYYLEVDYE